MTQQKLIKSLLPLAIFIFSLSSISAQNSDSGLWTSVNLSYKLSKKFKLQFREQFRLDEGMSTTDLYYSQLKVRYKISKSFNAYAAYRFTRKLDNQGAWQGWENIGRWNLDLKYGSSLGDIDWSLRLRYQDRSNFTKDQPNLQVMRYKLSAYYNIPGFKWNPELAYEFFQPVSAGIDVPNGNRLTLLVHRKINKRNSFHIGYSYESTLGFTPSSQEHILRLSYAFDLN